MSMSEVLAHLIFLALCALAIYILGCKILDDWDPNWKDKAKWQNFSTYKLCNMNKEDYYA